MPINVPPKVRLKTLPIQTRVLLRLVGLIERKVTSAELRLLAKELDSKYPEVMKAVELLIAEKLITVLPKDANAFDFNITNEVREKFKLHASNFAKHLKAQAERKERMAKYRQLFPAHLPPITQEQRAPWINKAKAIVLRIDPKKDDPKRTENLTLKVAGCLARLGEEEVNKIVDAALLAYKSLAKPGMSPVALFFHLYSACREVKIPAPVPVAA